MSSVGSLGGCQDYNLTVVVSLKDGVLLCCYLSPLFVNLEVVSSNQGQYVIGFSDHLFVFFLDFIQRFQGVVFGCCYFRCSSVSYVVLYYLGI